MNIYLIEAFKKLKKTQKEIQNDLNVSQPYVSSLVNGKKPVGKEMAKQLSKLYGFDEGLILSGEIKKDSLAAPKQEAVQLTDINYMKVPVVPVQAHAGFLNGYGDVEYWDTLPFEMWEVDKEYKGKYVVFEVKGDSMDDDSARAIKDRDKVLCREINREHWKCKLHINKWNFVIVHKTEGVIIKRIIEHNVKECSITCHSLNPFYEDFKVELNDVIALYNVVDLKRRLYI